MDNDATTATRPAARETTRAAHPETAVPRFKQ